MRRGGVSGLMTKSEYAINEMTASAVSAAGVKNNDR